MRPRSLAPAYPGVSQSTARTIRTIEITSSQLSRAYPGVSQSTALLVMPSPVITNIPSAPRRGTPHPLA